MKDLFALAIGAVLLASCGPSQDRSESVGRATRRFLAGEMPSAATSAPTTADDEDDETLQAILHRVSAARHLPILRPVVAKNLSRDALEKKLREKMDSEIPPGVLVLQGESLRALGLVPLDYDFEAGLLRLLKGRIAGLYDPDDRTMYLLDDLGDRLKEETLNHELVHALQDQSFDLAPMLKFREGKGDETAARQTLIEGDATSAMFEAAGASSLDIDEGTIRRLFVLSTRLSGDGIETPSILLSSLVSPYTDGFALVSALRKKGGWAEVDAAFRHLPETTEQVLHPEKLATREPALVVADPTVRALGPAFSPAFVDSMGELGLRQTLEEWEARTVARDAAAGWGGDRYVVARATTTEGGAAYAVAIHIKMDTEKDAQEVATILSGAIGSAGKGGKPTKGGKAFCAERAALGPIAWTIRGADIAVVAGPYEKKESVVHSVGTCKTATAWLDETLGAGR
jgi:hypothetical protein